MKLISKTSHAFYPATKTVHGEYVQFFVTNLKGQWISGKDSCLPLAKTNDGNH